jgi:RNA polymerase sigma-70 factor (ECF subfamily)
MDLDLQKLKQQDPVVFEDMVRTYEKKIYNIAHKMVKDPTLSCDITQDVFIKIYRALPSFKENSSLSTWIYRITMNVCIDYQRKLKRENTTPFVNHNEDQEEYLIEVPDHSFSPEAHYEKKELQEQLQKALMKLSYNHRAIIILKDIEHQSYEEIGRILNCTQGTVKSRLNRGREQLRNLLAKEGNFFNKYLSNT